MTAIQLPLDLVWRESAEAGDFIVTTSNADAVAWIDKWPDWPAAGILLLGDHSAGKTHLAKVWQQRAQAVYVTNAASLNGINTNAVLDDVDGWAKRESAALFHAINRAKEHGFSLLLCAAKPPESWQVTLPDLLSRLKALPVSKLGEPDDALLASLFTRALSQRGMTVKPDVLDYIFPRLPRRAADIVDFAMQLDAFTLQSGKGLTLPVVRAFLGTQL